jgi:hypothetical protein
MPKFPDKAHALEGGSGIMTRLRGVVKWLVCIFGGACAASFLTVVIAVVRFGLNDPERSTAFLQLWARVAGILGAAIAVIIVLRSKRRAVS